MARAVKEAFITEMKQELEKAAGFLFVDFTGLTVVEADLLRRKTRQAQVSYRVVKNSLMARALQGTAYAAVAACLKGSPTGVIFGYDDAVSPAKVSFAFAKECEHLKVKGGVVDDETISVEQAQDLASLPSREELQGTVVALAQGPGGKLAGQLKHPAGRLVGALEALEQRLGGDT